MRVKTGFARRRAHNKIHGLTKGYRMTKNRLVKVGKEAILHAGAYAYNGRKEKKQYFRRLWIIRLNGVLRDHGLSYSTFIKKLKNKNIALDRKVLAEIALRDPAAFKQILNEI